jgi:hypothetical protein
MYRDEESVAAEHAADVQAELEAALAPRLGLARRWQPRFWHWVVACVLWIPVSCGGPDHSFTWANASWLGSWMDHPDLFFTASALTLLATWAVVATFFAAMALAARHRAGKILRRFGPPPAAMRASDRLPLLKKRLADLRFHVAREGQPAEQGEDRP